MRIWSESDPGFAPDFGNDAAASAGPSSCCSSRISKLAAFIQPGAWKRTRFCRRGTSDMTARLPSPKSGPGPRGPPVDTAEALAAAATPAPGPRADERWTREHCRSRRRWQRPARSRPARRMRPEPAGFCGRNVRVRWPSPMCSSRSKLMFAGAAERRHSRSKLAEGFLDLKRGYCRLDARGGGRSGCGVSLEMVEAVGARGWRQIEPAGLFSRHGGGVPGRPARRTRIRLDPAM